MKNPSIKNYNDDLKNYLKITPTKTYKSATTIYSAKGGNSSEIFFEEYLFPDGKQCIVLNRVGDTNSSTSSISCFK